MSPYIHILMSITDGPIWATNSSAPEADTSSYEWILGTKGDTIRIMTPRTINSPTATGLPGELTWGSETVLGITTYYLYLCVGNNEWRRFSSSLLP